MNKFKLNILLLSTIVFTSGCTVTETPFCKDQDYALAMYNYLQDDPNIDEQVDLMNSYFQTCEANGKVAAPGSYAHMGLLASKQGNNSLAFDYFNKEKQHFPEATHYMDFLMKHKQATSAKTGATKK